MTEQEAEALFNRIPRVWAHLAPRLIEGDTGKLPFEFIFSLRDNWKLTYICSSNAPCPFVMVTKESFEMLCLQDGTIYYDSAQKHGQEKILMESLLEFWLPSFRRGLWLSGCPIEASAHEKAEWLQALTHEEIEAWNLDFS